MLLSSPHILVQNKVRVSHCRIGLRYQTFDVFMSVQEVLKLLVCYNLIWCIPHLLYWIYISAVLTLDEQALEHLRTKPDISKPLLVNYFNDYEEKMFVSVYQSFPYTMYSKSNCIGAIHKRRPAKIRVFRPPLRVFGLKNRISVKTTIGVRIFWIFSSAGGAL